jgi:hypothetical protein
MATTSINNPTGYIKKLPQWKFAEYYAKGYRWCRVCEIWFHPDEKAVFCKECGKFTRCTVKSKKKKKKKENETNGYY